MQELQMTGPSPVDVAFAGPHEQRRLTVGFRAVLLVPHFFVMVGLRVAASLVVLAGWFAALILGRLPQGIATFLSGCVRYYLRVYAYFYLLTDSYPPFSLSPETYPVELSVSPGRLNRLAVLFRGLLVIPAYLLWTLIGSGAGVVLFFAWLIVLVTGRMPPSLHQALAAALRYQTRLFAYFGLVTATYPSGLFGDQPSPEPSIPTLAAQAARGGGDAWGVGGEYPPQPAAPWLAPPVGAEPLATRLVLTKAAKRLVVLFLVIGALLSVGSSASGLVSGSGSLRNIDTSNALDAYYSHLSQDVNRVETQAAACQRSGDQPCEQKAAGTLAMSFSHFADQLDRLSVPATSHQDAALLSADSRSLADLLRQAGSATSATAYQTSASGFQSRATAFDRDYRTFQQHLING